ncbi:hypothetical protein SLS64_010206 [Diaporthe eres]
MEIPIFRDKVYIVQGPKNVNKLLQSGQVTVNRSYGLVLQRCFGMNKKAADAYHSDTSGSRLKPLAGSSSRTEERILHLTHENLVTGLLQNGLEPTMDRLMSHLEQSLEEEQQGHDVILGCYNHGWRDEPELASFFQQHLGSSIIKALFGDLLLELNPDFIDDLWKYDEDIIRTIQRIPSVTNVVPSSVTLALHIFKSPEILASLRASLDQLPDTPSCKDLEAIPLLSSMYAETLRFGVQIHIPRNAPHHELEVGGVRIQKNKLVMANTWLAHMDEAADGYHLEAASMRALGDF